MLIAVCLYFWEKGEVAIENFTSYMHMLEQCLKHNTVCVGSLTTKKEQERRRVSLDIVLGHPAWEEKSSENSNSQTSPPIALDLTRPNDPQPTPVFRPGDG